MASPWKKPGFAILTVGGECTAYAGADIAGQPPGGPTSPAREAIAGNRDIDRPGADRRRAGRRPRPAR